MILVAAAGKRVRRMTIVNRDGSEALKVFAAIERFGIKAVWPDTFDGSSPIGWTAMGFGRGSEISRGTAIRSARILLSSRRPTFRAASPPRRSSKS